MASSKASYVRTSNGLQYECSKEVLAQGQGLFVFLALPLGFICKPGKRAEREGFEPSRRLDTAYAISNRAPSANSDTSPGATAGVYQIADLLLLPLEGTLLALPHLGVSRMLRGVHRVAQGEGGEE